MVLSLNKWLFLPVLAFGLLSAEPSAHPFHVSVVTVNHNAPDKNLEITCKLFTDDFENILEKKYHQKVNLVEVSNKSLMDSLVKKYITSHLGIAVNGKRVTLSYLGFENDGASTYCYLEVHPTLAVSKIDVADSLLYDLFDDQVNIVHVIVGGKRKSNKLNYPESNLSIQF
ncbi:MAG: DUF6702 family protein [Chitinophagaceae bacterium]|nr:hypothetical protein [Chitinophagaceae bacterium]HQV07363.1 hypothetical protein [Chitinophagaceae bacterium]